MSKKLSQTWRVGEDDKLPSFGTTSSQPLELLTRRCDPPRACARAPLLRDASSTAQALWMDGWTGPIRVFDWMDELNRRLLEASWMWMVGTGGFCMHTVLQNSHA
jgi:hypothetical protein